MFKVKRQWNTKQVAQRATIAHLSPMCQGQMWYLQKDRIKNNREKVETYFFPLFFYYYKSMGLSVAMETRLWSNLPQNLMQPFPHPSDPTHKIWSRLADWLQRYSSSKVWNFRHSRASNSKMSGLFGPKSNWTELLCLSWLPATLMMIRSKMNELACMETPFSHYKSMGIFLDAQGQLIP